MTTAALASPDDALSELRARIDQMQEDFDSAALAAERARIGFAEGSVALEEVTAAQDREQSLTAGIEALRGRERQIDSGVRATREEALLAAEVERFLDSGRRCSALVKDTARLVFELSGTVLELDQLRRVRDGQDGSLRRKNALPLQLQGDEAPEDIVRCFPDFNSVVRGLVPVIRGNDVQSWGGNAR